MFEQIANLFEQILNLFIFSHVLWGPAGLRNFLFIVFAVSELCHLAILCWFCFCMASIIKSVLFIKLMLVVEKM